MKSGIYLIRNIINDKKYIGSTVSTVGFNMRWSKHISELRYKKHGNPHLQLAWDKYSKDNFEFSVIEECPDNILVAREQHWINHYKTMNNKYGYNLREAGHNGKLSEETKRKISKNRSGISLGKDNHFYGKHHSEETREKISKSRKGQCVGHIGYMTGKRHSKEWKKKMSLRMTGNKFRKGTKQSEETKRKISVSNMGRTISEKCRLKIIECNKNRIWSDDSRRKISEAHKGKKASFETRQKMRDT